ncbi:MULTISPECIES: hypothetical protein [unclassified Tenacibaculum]|uniref:hypothetical protein n=1 Tax=unclassified Tenacibaculum TaxID=2635139 RepID=UPI001F45AEC8|nr:MULTISPECIES: hypothetical protein [unclassified Tenacibaculum]MCF2876381.1 hypothetical protein [Tenacibaculum sp. Cn5-1]MCF2936476.1 hypothetical protein [Tenacibaculum sp. Cn5-34]MCG7512799.1 hypothetical protein [Tenacibaculum sp. Cn5-46]
MSKKDIREILKEDVEKRTELSANHRLRFQQKLMEELHEKPSKKKSYQWLYVAASIVVLLGLGIKFYPATGGEIVEPTIVEKSNSIDNQISLGNVSPELKTLETYYVNTINYELSQLELTEDNKELFDGYIAKIGELTKEYKSLTEELNKKGVNDDTINALIGNLQLRLQLLKRMQKQLKEFKNPTQNDIQTI